MGEYSDRTFCLEVWGSYACFTRPEMKVERVSYDTITPSAARAIFEAVFWKPAFYWRIRKIEVLNPIKWISVRRNEVGAVANLSSDGIYIEEKRQQRAGLFLKDVRYRLHADLVFIPPRARNDSRNPLPRYLTDPDEAGHLSDSPEDDRSNENPMKYYQMFERRARKGQCFNQPYLGCREFSCYFKLVDPEADAATPINETRELGFMLYDMDFSDETNITPAFFKANLINGVVNVPDWDSEEVKR